MRLWRRRPDARLGIGKLLVGGWLTLFALSAAGAIEHESNLVVANGKRISIQYTLRLPDKTLIQTNAGAQPLRYISGYLETLPALQEALLGLKVGETKSVTLPPEKGYGVYDPKAFEEVDISKIPPEARWVGATLDAADPKGRVSHARVQEIREKTAVLNFNHPLAGKTLVFDVKILKIEDPP